MNETFVDELISMVRHMSRFERDTVCCGTVTVQQCFVLQRLIDRPSMNSELARDAGSSPSAMTRLVDGLIKSAWAERVPDETDRRKTMVQLTNAGRKEALRLKGLTVESVGVVLEKIPSEKREQVIESIALLREALDDVGSFGCC